MKRRECGREKVQAIVIQNSTAIYNCMRKSKSSEGKEAVWNGDDEGSANLFVEYIQMFRSKTGEHLKRTTLVVYPVIWRFWAVSNAPMGADRKWVCCCMVSSDARRGGME